MKAVIIPLSNIFYEYEKYDGMGKFDRFLEKHPFLNKKFDEIYTNHNFIRFTVILVIAFYLIPYMLWLLPLHPLQKTFEIAMAKLDNFFEYLSWPTFGTYPAIELFEKTRKRGYHFIIYYTTEMVPEEPHKRTVFFNRLEELHSTFPYFHFSEANNLNDILDIIQKNEIDLQESHFICHKKIDLSSSTTVNFPDFIEDNEFHCCSGDLSGLFK